MRKRKRTEYTPKNPTIAERSYLAANGVMSIPMKLRTRLRKGRIRTEETARKSRESLAKQFLKRIADVRQVSEFMDARLWGSRVQMSVIYTMYVDWCRGKGHDSVGLKFFSQTVRHLGYNITAAQGKHFVV